MNQTMSDNFKKYIIAYLVLVTGCIIVILTFFDASKIYIAIVTILGLGIAAIKEIEKIKEKERQIEEKKKEDVERRLTNDVIRKIDEELNLKTKELEYRQKIITEFMRLGVVREDELIKNLNQESFITLYHFNKSLKQLTKITGNYHKPMEDLLKEIGFISVGYGPGSYFYHVVSVNSLPSELRDVAYLEAYVKKKISVKWDIILDIVRKKDPIFFRKIKKENIFNLSYLIGRIYPSQLALGYINFSTFDKDFLTFAMKFSNLQTLKIDEKKLSEISQLASIDLFVQSIMPTDRMLIKSNESNIKSNLNVNKILDYGAIPVNKWVEELLKIFSNDEPKCQRYASEIQDNCKKYCSVLKEFL